MLVLARKAKESVVIGSAGELRELLRITVIHISEGRVKLGFKANNDVIIHREEVWERFCEDTLESSPK
jgi:carbon storage regulator CsrA